MFYHQLFGTIISLGRQFVSALFLVNHKKRSKQPSQKEPASNKIMIAALNKQIEATYNVFWNSQKSILPAVQTQIYTC